MDPGAPPASLPPMPWPPRELLTDLMACLNAQSPGAYQTGLVREHDRLDAVAETEFGQDVADMCLHRTDGHVQLGRDAVRHNSPGGDVTVRTGADAVRSWVQVSNTGDDLSTMDLDRLFEPFNRGTRTRLDGDGAGLGLSIVAAVARVHGGSVCASARPATDGGGLVMTLQLPAARAT